MITIDDYGVEIHGDQDPVHYNQIIEQVEMDWAGYGLNGTFSSELYEWDDTEEFLASIKEAQ